MENIIRKLSALLVKSRKGRCVCIEVKILEELMIDRTAFHGNLEMEERIEGDFPVTGKISFRVLAEILMVLIHLFNFRQQDLFDSFVTGR